MNDTITLPRATVQQVLEALEWSTPFQDATVTHSDAITALRAALEQQQAEPVYKDSTPHLHVGDSAFESWFQAQPFATQTGIKQISRDSYAAGMGDPLVVAAPQQQAEPVGSLSVRYYRGCKSMTNTDFDYNGDLPEGDYELYTAPPQRKPLSDEEIDALAVDEDGLPNSHLEFARAIEAAHSIKEGT